MAGRKQGEGTEMARNECTVVGKNEMPRRERKRERERRTQKREREREDVGGRR